MRYDAFISYSHAADGKLAPALQRALQRMAKRWYRRRALEVFRDETGLSVDPHLWGAIVKALDDAEWFLLLTSPGAARSEWVNREIEHWKANRPHDRILPVLTDGHWEWDSRTGDFTPDSDAVPPGLRGVFTDEPRHLDLRWAHEETELDLHNGRFRNAIAEIAAPLHGCSKDEIEGEDVRQHRRTVRIAWSAAAMLAVLALAAVTGAGFAVRNAHTAEQRRVQAVAQRLAAQSQTELERPDLAFLLAANGYRTDATPATASALLTAVADRPEIKMRIDPTASVTAVATSAATDRIWIGTTDGVVASYRFSDGTELGRTQGVFGSDIVAMALTGPGADTVVVADEKSVTTLDADLRPTIKRSSPSMIRSLAVDARTGRVAAGTTEGTVMVWQPGEQKAGVTIQAIPPHPDVLDWVPALAWTGDDGLIATGVSGMVVRLDVAAADRPVWVQSAGGSRIGRYVSAVTVLDDGTLVGGGSDGSMQFWDARTGAVLGEESGAHLGMVRGVVATGDSAAAGSVASVAEDGYLIFWDHVARTPLAVPPPVRVAERVATSVAWDPAATGYGVAGTLSGGAVLLDYSAGARRPIAKPVPGWEHAHAVAISPAGDRLAVVRTVLDGTTLSSELTLTDPRQPDPAARSVRFRGAVSRVAFAADGRRVLVMTLDGHVAAWDGEAAEATVTDAALPGQSDYQLAVSSDGATVATRGLSTVGDAGAAAPVRLWRLDGLRLTPTGDVEAGQFAPGLVFTPDGSHLVIGGANAVWIHPMAGGGTVTIALPDQDVTNAVGVSQDGTTIAVGLWHSVRLFDLTGHQIGEDMRVPALVTALAFVPGGDELAAVSQDGRFLLWDLTTRQLMSTTKPLVAARPASPGDATYTSLAVGRGLAVTASVAEGELVLWSLDPGDWIAEGCRVHRRELNDAEKARFGLEGSAPVCTN